MKDLRSLHPGFLVGTLVLIAILAVVGIESWNGPASVIIIDKTRNPGPAPAKSPSTPLPSSEAPVTKPASSALALPTYLAFIQTLSSDQFASEFARLVESRRAEGDFGYDLPYTRSNLDAKEGGDPFIKALLSAWGEKSPATALAFLMDFEGKKRDVVNRYIDNVLAGWSLHDAPGAWDWGVQSARDYAASQGKKFSMDFGFMRTASLGSDLLKRKQYATAAELTARDDEYSGQFAIMMSSSWAAVDPSGTAAWILTLPLTREITDERPTVPDTRRNALRGLTEALANEDPGAARALIRIADDPLNKGALAVGAINAFKNNAVSPLESLRWLTTVISENPGATFSNAIKAYGAARIGRVEPGSPAEVEEQSLVASIGNETIRADLQRTISASRPSPTAAH
jgi:hypothetical protein